MLQIKDLPLFVAGVVGPRGDGYVVRGPKMTPEEAEVYHSLQVGVLAEECVDIICMYGMTYPEEAIGILRAVKKVGREAAVGFSLDEQGNLGTGQSLEEAIRIIDEATDSQPLFYAIHCTHVSRFIHLFAGKFQL